MFLGGGPLGRLLSFALSVVLRRPEPLPPHVAAGGSVVLDAFNVNFLALFLAANLLVGAANASLYTVHADRLTSMAVLAAYAFAVCATAVVWRAFGVTLKFW